MSRFIQKRGFSLNETMIVIVIIGCLIAMAIGAFNMSKINNETIAVKQAKLESALKTATMSIMGQGKITPEQACNAELMRDKYAEKLSGAKAIDNVTVNGVKVSALEVKDYGIVAFEATEDCEAVWYATGSVASTTGTTSTIADIEKALEIYTEIVPDIAKTSNIEGKTFDIVIPDSVAAKSSARKGATARLLGDNGAKGSLGSGTLSANAAAYNVSGKGYTFLYGASNTPLTRTTSRYNTDITACQAGESYAYHDSTSDIDVAYYEKLESGVKSFCPGNGIDETTNELVTVGMVNNACLYGIEGGQVSQCSCPSTKRYFANVQLVGSIRGACLENCEELNMQASGPNCVCKPNTTWNDTYKRCVGEEECPADYLKKDNGQCVCKTEDELKDMDPNYFDVCEVYDPTNTTGGCKKLKPNWNKTTGTCVCPSPFEVDNENNCICNAPRSMQNGTCQCDSTLVTLTGEEVFDATAANCKVNCAASNLIANPNRSACINPGCENPLMSYDISAGQCVCDATKANDQSINIDEVFDATSATCKKCRNANREYGVNGACVCKSKSALTLSEYEIYDPTQESCVYTCKNGARANADHTECIGACLQYYDYPTETLKCIQNPSDAKTTECLANTNRVYDGASPVCSVECQELTTANSVHKICECDRAKVTTALALPENLNKVYDLDNAPACMERCTGQTVPSDDRSVCEDVPCLKETTDNIKANVHCIANPTAQDAACLTGNYVADPTNPATCSKECTGLTSANTNHLTCDCDRTKVATALTLNENLNKIYDLNNAPTCMAPCTGQTVPSDNRTVCENVPCLKETTDNIKANVHCIANPTAQDAACLTGNYIADPTIPSTCSQECTGLTSANTVHLACECDGAKVAAALALPANAGKIYALNDAPACMADCPAGTYTSEDKTRCIPVDCLKETTDRVSQHCIARPTNEKTIECLQGSNYASDPSNPDSCKVDCGNRKSPNDVYKACVCDLNKMVNNNLFTSDNYKFDTTSSTCESPCPSSFTYRDPDDLTASTCRCPRLKPAAVTVQNGYFYHAGSTVLSGPTACQLECPTTRNDIVDWITINRPSFTRTKVVVGRTYFVTIYDSTKSGCLYDCEGNLVANDEKLECICPLTANDCQAGTYFDANACECKPCPVGHYCPGPVPPIPCPCGTYGDRTGLATEACSGDCPAGYYCPEASTTPRLHPCPAGYTCPAGHGPQYCAPRPCTFPATSTATAVICDRCQTEAEIRRVQPNYFAENEIYVNDLSMQCKKCKSNMVYDSTGKCACPPDKPYWDGQKCTPCKTWGTLYFARQGSNKPNCTLYNHMMGKKGACFDFERVPSDDMKRAAQALSNADKNRTFNGVYAYMVSYKDGHSTVEGVFTARSWYNTFGSDLSSQDTKKSQQSDGNCSQVCGSNTECVNTCNYMKGFITQNTMFQHCTYAVNNQWLGNSYGDADELCVNGQITIVRDNNQCVYGVGAILRQTISPIVLDLKGNGFKYTAVEDGVIFDLNNDGVAEQTAWTKEQKEFDNAFLVLDKNGNGQVDNGGELFGDQNGAENGFMELSKYDDNGDKVINKDDKVYNELRLWVDFNKNAKVDYNADGTTQELKTLEEAGVTELSVNYEVQKDSKGNILRDIYGNITGFLGSFKMMVQNAAGKVVEVVRKMMDVFFVTQ